MTAVSTRSSPPAEPARTAEPEAVDPVVLQAEAGPALDSRRLSIRRHEAPQVFRPVLHEVDLWCDREASIGLGPSKDHEPPIGQDVEAANASRVFDHRELEQHLGSPCDQGGPGLNRHGQQLAAVRRL